MTKNAAVGLVGGGTKKRQPKDIEVARERWADYERRKKEERDDSGQAQAQPEFRKALLREAAECLLNGDLGTGRGLLRNYVNATVGFGKLATRTRIPAKSLMRMLGPKG